MSADTNLMPIPGPVDPVPVPRAAPARADGKVELIGLPKEQIRVALEEAGLEPKQAKLRAKQIWHWAYNRGVSDFTAMTDIAKVQQPWLTERPRYSFQGRSHAYQELGGIELFGAPMASR